MEGRSEKLAQEGLRGNRDRFAVGKRICSGVREVAHDLEGVRSTCGFLHRQYQTSDNARMAIAKLAEALEWYLRQDPVGARVPRARMVGRSPRDRRPVRRSVHTSNNLNRRAVPAFQNHGRRLRPLSSAVIETRG